MSSLRKPTRVVSITSGKGGVGKTHTTVNLGLALSRMGRKVLLLDADLGLANINVLLGFKPAATLNELLHGKVTAEELVVSYAPGFDIIPASSGIPELTRLSDEEKMALVGAFDEFGDKYDYMLIDTAAGIGDNVVYFNTSAEEVIVVIDHEPTSITDAYALIKVLSTHGLKEFNIMVNRAPTGSDGRATYAQLATVGTKFLSVALKFLGAMSEDDSVSEAVVRQRPFLDLFPSSKASRDITRIAKAIDSNEGLRTPKGGMQFFFRAMLEAQL